MKTKFLLKTNNGNYYLQDLVNNQLIFIPPKLYKTIMSEKKYDIDDYYFRKYSFLKNKLNSDINLFDMFSQRLSPQHIRPQIINTKQITFEVTDKCNLECKYCAYGEYYYGYDTRERKNMPIEIAINVMNQGNRKFYYNMTTNAILLNKYMDFLVEKELRWLISFDGDERSQSYRIDHSEKTGIMN